MHSPGSKASASGLDSAHGYTGCQDKDEDLFYHYGLTQVVMRHHFHDNHLFYHYGLFNPGGYGRSSSGRYRRLQHYVKRTANHFVRMKQILCDWQTNIK